LSDSSGRFRGIREDSCAVRTVSETAIVCGIASACRNFVDLGDDG